MLGHTAEKVDNTFIEHQLTLAHVALKANDKARALAHYQSAYDEALWLCEYNIDHADSCAPESAKQAYACLASVSKPLLQCIKSAERAEEIKSQLLGVSMRVSSEFKVDLNSEFLSEVAFRTTSLMPLKLNFFKSVFA